jgi:hypothetical protein
MPETTILPSNRDIVDTFVKFQKVDFDVVATRLAVLA